MENDNKERAPRVYLVEVVEAVRADDDLSATTHYNATTAEVCDAQAG
jgi:hypothetical protein